MLERLPRVPVDTFLLALLAVVTLAALFPATGTYADVLDVATKVAIALLFLLYGARLSPTEALHGLQHWLLRLVLAATFVIFPILGLAARALVPSVLTPGLYTGVLFLCRFRRQCSPRSRLPRWHMATCPPRLLARRCRTSSAWRSPRCLSCC
jgi:sodium/bile acid cotransporter 7